MEIHAPNDNKVDFLYVGVVGDPGSGKTQLCGTIPHAFFIDADDGASNINRPSVTFPYNARGYEEIKQLVQAMVRLQPDENNMLTVPGTSYKFRTLVIDTLNLVQQRLAISIPPERNTMRWYGKLLKTLVDDIITPTKQINANVVLIMHSAKEETESLKLESRGEVKERELDGTLSLPSMKISLAGSISKLLPGLFDATAYIALTQTGKRLIITQPRQIGTRYISGDVAKDRYYLFGGRDIEWTFVNGKPNTDVFAKIFEKTRGGTRDASKQAVVDEQTAIVLEAAKEAGFYNKGQIAGDNTMEEIYNGDVITFENYEELVPELLKRIADYLPEAVVTHRIAEVKKAWITKAKEVGLIKQDARTAEDFAPLKVALGDLYANISAADWTQNIIDGEALIASAAQEK